MGSFCPEACAAGLFLEHELFVVYGYFYFVIYSLKKITIIKSCTFVNTETIVEINALKPIKQVTFVC